MNFYKNKKIIYLFANILVLIPFLSFASIITCNEPDKCNVSSLFSIFNGLITWFTGIFSSVAAIGFAVAGIKMLMNPANSSERENAKRTLKYVSIGYLIFLSGVLVVKTIINELVSKNIDALRFFN